MSSQDEAPSPATVTATASSTSPTTSSTQPPASPVAPSLNPLGSHPVYPPVSSTTANPDEDGSRGQSTSATPRSSELARAQMTLKAALRHFADFPIPGINFVDIMPLFMDPSVHTTLGDALELQVKEGFKEQPDVVVGLDARGFLFGPGLALRLGVGFAPVRKKGKLPGPCVTAAYEKEYGTDLFQMQQDAVKAGQQVLIVDDIIATGGSAKAAADLVTQVGGIVMGYLFVLEIPGLNGKDKLDSKVPTVILLDGA